MMGTEKKDQLRVGPETGAEALREEQDRAEAK